MPRTKTKNLTSEEKIIRRREQKKISMRRARAKLSDAAKEEIRKKDRERYHGKKERGEIKTIIQYSSRMQRQIRKMWREKAKKRRELQKMRKATAILLEENTPPSSPSSSFSRVEVGKAIAARNKRQRNAENVALKIEVLEMARKIKRYRMRVKRLEAKYKKIVTATASNKKVILQKDVKKAVHDFLNQDEYSRLTSGKKETITRRKIKRQIRLLNDTLLNLHVIFKNKTGINISYQTFRRYRPFWVLFPKASSRNTCLCALHENSDYIVQSLQKANIIPYGSALNVAKILYCNNTLNPKCLERTCKDCKETKLRLNDYNEIEHVTFNRWVVKNVDVIIKGKLKQIKKCVKETVKTSKASLVKLFYSNLPIYMQHIANMINQLRAIQTIKKQLSHAEGLLHIDFSENYNCKYSAEVQSAHFGGSKPQLSLHTCVYYSIDLEAQENGLKTTSMCSISENLRHDPVMICAHLKPILHRIKEISPYLTDLHITSDGPTTQYRNKLMFYFIAHFIGKELNNIHNIIWHYSEKGHGKGAPDGVGGCIKRLCDNSVAMGKDVADYDSLISCLKESCKGIEIYGIGDPDIQDIQEIADTSAMKTFKGTLKIHQLSWSRSEPNILHARRLTCLSCEANMVCPHFEIGQINVQPEHVENSRASTPRSFVSVIRSISPRSIATPDASTISFRSGLISPITPESGPSQTLPSRPFKRLRLFADSNDSDNIFSPQPIEKIISNPCTDSEDDDKYKTEDESAKPLPSRLFKRLRLFAESDDSDDNFSLQSVQKELRNPCTDSEDDNDSIF